MQRAPGHTPGGMHGAGPKSSANENEHLMQILFYENRIDYLASIGAHDLLFRYGVPCWRVSGSPAKIPFVKTSHDFPPIPIRSLDWSAWDDNTYDGAPDAGPQVVGHGATEADAVADFWEQWEEKYGTNRVDTLAIH